MGMRTATAHVKAREICIAAVAALIFAPAVALAAAVGLQPGSSSIAGAGATGLVSVAVDTAAGVLSASFVVQYDPTVVAATLVDQPPAGCSMSSTNAQCTSGPVAGLRCDTNNGALDCGRCNDPGESFCTTTTDCPGGFACSPGVCGGTANDVRFAIACSNPLSGAITLGRITFLGVQPGISVLSVSLCSLEGGSGSLPCSATGGSISVLQPTVPPSSTPTRTPTATPTRTPTQTATFSLSVTPTPSRTPTSSRTPTGAPTDTPSLTPPSPSTPTRTPTRSPTVSPSRSMTVAPTATATPDISPTPSQAQCPGDCDGLGHVTVNELVVVVNVALGKQSAANCSNADGDRDGVVTIDEVVRAVNAALNGCD